MEFVAPSFDSSSSSSDEELLDEIDAEHQIAMQVTIACVNTWEFFTPMELEEGGGHFVDPNIGVRDVLMTMMATSSLFKSLTNFNLTKFEELAQLVVSTIIGHVRSIEKPQHNFGQLSKLTLEQGLFNFILYMKHDNVIKYDAFLWNWNKSVINDVGIFIASCINFTIANEIRWPVIEGHQVLAMQLPQFQGCIGFIDGTFIKIHKPWNNPTHQSWYNGQKKMYCMNNIMVVDHHGLFIYLDLGHPELFHDVNILWQSNIHTKWHQHFVHTNAYFEYLLGDPRYMGKDMFVMRCIGRCELAPRTNLAAIVACNKMHACFFLKPPFHFICLTGLRFFRVKACILRFWVCF
jgi:hypothetical protein